MNYTDLISNLNNFKKRLETQIKNRNKTFKIAINICLVVDKKPTSKYIQENCIAMVKNNNSLIQCSRKKKFGQLCGLHNNMSSTISTVFSNDTLLYNKSNRFSIELEFPEINNNSIENNELYNIDDPYYSVYFNGFNYYINCLDGTVYINTIDTYENIGHINNLDIPISIY
jgi:hypothetical protein